MNIPLFSNEIFEVAEEVREALYKKLPIVALESTIIAHGMPFPKNVQTAIEVEKIVRDHGCIPATIAILEGKVHIGLNPAQLETLGKKEDVLKVSLRDIPYVVSAKLYGATTVAATMRIAKMAHIRFFVTGGIGGVHRQANESMDISADLTEMARTNVAVISAGVKSILDIGLTLEMLETLSIPVITFGQKEFPAFYSRQSGHLSPLTLNSEKEIASLIKAKWDLDLEGSVFIAVPPPEQHEIPYKAIEIQIQEALQQSKAAGISGKDVTPFLLKKMTELSGGKSLEANIALIKNNARIGASIAKAYSKL